jgi:hypothetical protein
MNNNTTSINYGDMIVKNLERAQMSKDYIIGFLQATLDQMKHLDSAEVTAYLIRTNKQAATLSGI